ncbi:MAG: hypothetical protein VX738_12735 [Planctomycetota bacterium]|nr:hypothetical protein [Planctomycetota bacterium]
MLRISILFLLFLITLATSGCGNNLRTQRQIDRMGMQRRALEDQIYDLQYEYDKQVKKLELENAKLRAQLDQLTPATPAVETRTPSDGPALIDLNPSQGAANRVRPTFHTTSHRPQSLVTTDSPSDANATVLEINRLRTVGRDLDGMPGDDTLLVHLQPRTSDGRFLPIPGRVIVEASNQQHQRLGRWEVSVSRLQEIIRQRDHQRTIPLQLDFPSGTPSHETLLLKVHFQPVNGPPLTAEHILKIIAKSASIPEWKPNR